MVKTKQVEQPSNSRNLAKLLNDNNAEDEPGSRINEISTKDTGYSNDLSQGGHILTQNHITEQLT